MKRRRCATCGNRIEVKFASLCDYCCEELQRAKQARLAQFERIRLKKMEEAASPMVEVMQYWIKEPSRVLGTQYFDGNQWLGISRQAMQPMWVTPIYGIPGSTTDPNKIHREVEPEVMCNGRPISFED